MKFCFVSVSASFVSVGFRLDKSLFSTSSALRYAISCKSLISGVVMVVFRFENKNKNRMFNLLLFNSVSRFSQDNEKPPW